MKSLVKYLKKEQDLYLSDNYEFDSRVSPSELIKVLNPKNQKTRLKSFQKKIKKGSKSGLKTLRNLTILHLLLMYSNQHYNCVEEVLPLEYDSQDDWLNNFIIKPYTKFLLKCCHSRQMYCKTKQYYSNQMSFQRMFYCINLLMQLFKPVQKMSMLGRYYKDQHLVVCSSFIETVAVQSQKIYTNFKNIISEMLFQPKKYLATKEDETLMKAILSESLITINEEMKKLFLDKYFYPYGKGIGVKLFRFEDQSERCNKTINSILNDHQDTNRRQQQQQLQQNLFPQDGQFNLKFYEQSLMQLYPMNTNEVYVGEEIAQEQQDIQQCNPNLNVNQETVQEQSCKQNTQYQQEIEQTGEGTLKNDL